MRGVAVVAAVALAGWVSAWSGESRETSAGPSQPGAGRALPAGLRGLESRLTALTPERPEGYFEVAEDVMDRSRQPEARALARQLLALSLELERRRRGNAGSGVLGSSVCLALAELSVNDLDRRWYLAAAGVLDPTGAVSAWTRAPERATDRHTAYLAATVVGNVRAGEGLHARQSLADPEVSAVLRRYQRLLSDIGAGGGVTNLEREADAWPCRECGNQRVTRRTTRGQTEYRLCATCRGNPGPTLTRGELMAQLRLESWLLSGIHTSWSAHLTADLDEPLRDPDPSEIAAREGADASRPYWREGGWSATP
ncbi:MAG: hypothetical protein HRU70_13400 [Phycisphaeraceae bacterium]|nr:MAG: hypothetical protein HRU70_13400 [Phycisphaeraceae bacterium]